MTTTKRGPYRNGIEKRRLIVESAIRVFGESGYRGGPLRAIAESVGSPASQIISLFGSKNGLLIAVLDHWDLQQVDEENTTGLDYVQSLRDRMRYSSKNRQWVEFFLTLGSEATTLDHPAHEYFVDRYEQISDRLQSEILRAAECGEIRPIEAGVARVEAQRLSAMMDGLQLQWLLNPDFDMVTAFDDYLDTVIARWRTSASDQHDIPARTSQVAHKEK